MSNAAITWARKVRGIPTGTKAVLLILADCANGDGECWPVQSSVAEELAMSREGVGRAIKQLVNAGHIRAHRDGGRLRYELVMSDHVISDHCDVRSPPRDVTSPQVRPEITSDAMSDHTNPKEPSKTQTNPNSLVRRQRIEVEGFAEFYAAYPRHVGRGQAARAYALAVKTAPPALLLAAAERFAVMRAGEDPQFTPHPATWLTGQRWLDDDQPRAGPIGAAQSAGPVTKLREGAFYAAQAVAARHCGDLGSDLTPVVPLLDRRREPSDAAGADGGLDRRPDAVRA